MPTTTTAELLVIAGPMFAGKTKLALEELEKARYRKKKSLVIKPVIDNRFGNDFIASRKIESGQSVLDERHPAINVGTVEDWYAALLNDHYHIVVIDEGQFFGDWVVPEIISLLRARADQDFKVIVSGLELDAFMRPFGVMPTLLALANKVIKCTAICMRCEDKPAQFTKRIDGSTDLIKIGSDNYEARCLSCYYKD